jgi:hypothetical protein
MRIADIGQQTLQGNLAAPGKKHNPSCCSTDNRTHPKWGSECWQQAAVAQHPQPLQAAS